MNCLLCYTPIDHKIKDETLTTKILGQLYQIPLLQESVSKFKENNGSLRQTCFDCFGYLKKAKILIKNFQKMQIKLHNIREKMKTKIEAGLIVKLELYENEPFLQEVLNCINNSEINFIPEEEDLSEAELDFSTDTDFSDLELEDKFINVINNSSNSKSDLKSSPKSRSKKTFTANQIISSDDSQSDSNSKSLRKSLKMELSSEPSKSENEKLEFENENEDWSENEIRSNEIIENISDKSESENESGPTNFNDYYSESDDDREYKPKIKSGIKKPKIDYNCEKCSFTTGDRKLFARHLNQIHQIKYYKCEEDGCQKSFSKEDSLQYHIKTTHRREFLKCDLCEMSFDHGVKLKKHILFEHTEGDHYHKCPEPGCDKKYKDSGSLRDHKRTHDPNFVHLICDICGQSYPKERLNRHKVLCHEKKTRFKCTHDDCDYATNNSESFRKHFVTHSKDHNFMCTICGKFFKAKLYLDKHSKNIHVDNKIIFKCDIEGCHQTFTASHSLKRHKKRKHKSQI